MTNKHEGLQLLNESFVAIARICILILNIKFGQFYVSLNFSQRNNVRITMQVNEVKAKIGLFKFFHPF